MSDYEQENESSAQQPVDGLSAAAIAELKSKHGDDLRLSNTPRGPVVVRKPKRAEWQEFVDTSAKDKTSKEAAMRALAINCTVVPDKAAVSTIFNEFPALTAKLTVVISEMAGDGNEFDAKKL